MVNVQLQTKRFLGPYTPTSLSLPSLSFSRRRRVGDFPYCPLGRALIGEWAPAYAAGHSSGAMAPFVREPGNPTANHANRGPGSQSFRPSSTLALAATSSLLCATRSLCQYLVRKNHGALYRDTAANVKVKWVDWPGGATHESASQVRPRCGSQHDACCGRRHCTPDPKGPTTRSHELHGGVF